MRLRVRTSGTATVLATKTPHTSIRPSSSRPFLWRWLPLILPLLVLTATTTIPAKTNNYPKAAELVTDGEAIDLASDEYTALFEELETVHHFSRRELLDLFSGLTIKRRVLELMDTQWEARPYYEYRPLFITPTILELGKKNLAEHHELFDRIEDRFGVNREVIVGIWGIESRFGTNQGNFELFRSLNTLFAAYPRRSDFFRKELIQFLLLCRANQIDPLSVRGSFAGAFGQAQFMPSSFNTYGVDFDGDGKVNLIHSLPDIFGSIANYLKSHGWVFDAPLFADLGTRLKSQKLAPLARQGLEGQIDWQRLSQLQQIPLPSLPGEGKLAILRFERSPLDGGGIRYIAAYPNFMVITTYNHSSKYAMAVSEMAEAFKTP